MPARAAEGSRLAQVNEIFLCGRNATKAVVQGGSPGLGIGGGSGVGPYGGVPLRAGRRSGDPGGMERRSDRVKVRRVYETPDADDGVRVLVDRLWPRGLAKTEARVDEWPKAVTPSTELRRWFHGPDGTYEEFCRRYEDELAEPEAAEALERLRGLAADGPLTLLTAAKDPDVSHASVLLRLLRGRR